MGTPESPVTALRAKRWQRKGHSGQGCGKTARWACSGLRASGEGRAVAVGRGCSWCGLQPRRNPEVFCARPCTEQEARLWENKVYVQLQSTERRPPVL